MRFIKMLIVLVVLVAVAFVLGWWARDFWQLYVAASALEKDMELVRELAQQPRADDLDRCRVPELDEQVVFEEEQEELSQPVKQYQLRFIDSSEYVVEVVCKREFLGAERIQEGTLLFGVEKVAGSGVAVPAYDKGSAAGRVLLQKGQHTSGLGFWENRWVERRSENEFTEVGYGVDAPKTTCEGWGYRCCGEGKVEGATLQEKVTDCPQSCFTACYALPKIVFFTADPPPQEYSRTLTLGPGRVSDTVTFSYLLEDDEGIEQVMIDFGDGEQFESGLRKNVVDHRYACDALVCKYTVTLEAFDVHGLPLEDSRQRELFVEVQNQ